MKKTYNYPGLVRLFEDAIQQAERFKSISGDLISLKPNPSSWSAGEIFEHIVRFKTIYLRAIHRTLDSGTPIITENPGFRPRKLMSYFIKTVRPPYKMKIKTITPMKPVDTSAEEYYIYLAQVIEMNKKIIEQLNELETRKIDLDRVKGKNPLFKFNMTLTEFYLMLDAHQQRHFWQAENTLKEISEKTN
ncbi:MAG: hypothetical protein EA359_12225 [Balneolaceae bacterium]|nr:MAG: hypothetical protein EA359_12225 [Balneolaceae bacterium]